MIHPRNFHKHMTAIKVHYTPISLRQYYDYVLCEDGSVTLPDDPIIVTLTTATAAIMKLRSLF